MIDWIVLLPIALLIAVAVGLALLFRMSWRVAEPDEALIVSGLRAGRPADSGGTMGFRIVTGRGTCRLAGRLTASLRR